MVGFGIGLIGCARPDHDDSRVTLQIPAGLKLMKPDVEQSRLSAYGLECFAVSITGPGITTNSRSCGPQTGIVSGFAAEGGTLTLTVPKGSERIVSVFMYLAPTGLTACPQWDKNFEDTYGSNYLKTYKLKDVKGIAFSKDEEALRIEVGAPASLDDNLLNQLGLTQICSPKISGYLTSSGSITNTEGFVLADDLSHPIHASFSLLNVKDYSLNSMLLLSSSNVFYFPNGAIELPPYLRSIVKHPTDPLMVVGLRDDGVLEEVSLATGISTELSGSACMFQNCNVPPWIRSITFGVDKQLYGLDHGGNFYLLSNAEIQVVSGVSVPPYVEQVVF